jgi:hypothetical protein
MGLLDVINSAREMKNDFVSSLKGPGSAYARAENFKGDLLNQPMRDIGFGDAQQILKPPQAISFDDGTAQNAGLLMQQQQKNIGAFNPSAGLIDLGNISLETPDLTGIYGPNQDEYLTPVQREQKLVADDNYGVLQDGPDNTNNANPYDGLLRMF